MKQLIIGLLGKLRETTFSQIILYGTFEELLVTDQYIIELFKLFK